MNAAYLTPAITLFNEDGTLDLASQERLFNNLIDQGVDGILVEGSSSEFFAMPMNQRREMAKFAIEKIDHRVKLIIGTHNNSSSPEYNEWFWLLLTEDFPVRSESQHPDFLSVPLLPPE